MMSVSTMSDDDLVQNLLEKENLANLEAQGNVYNANLSEYDLQKLLQMYSNKPKPVYSSIYQVFFKLKYYVAFNIPPNNPWLLLFGSSKDHVDQRFLLFFYDYESFFTVGLAGLVMFAHISFLLSIIKEITQECFANSSSDLYFAVLLCTFYAANVATDSFMSYLPFEVFGKTRKELKDYWNKKIEDAGGEVVDNTRREPMKNTFAGSMLLQQIAHESVTRFSEVNPLNLNPLNINPLNINPLNNLQQLNPLQLQQQFQQHLPLHGDLNKHVANLKTGVSTVFLWIVILVILFSNFLLLISVGIILGTNDTYVGVVQNFIAVEIVTYVHELVPKALQIFDADPDYCRQSWFEVVQEMETSGELPVGVLAKSSPTSWGLVRHPARIWYQRLYIFYFLFVWGMYFATQHFCDDFNKIMRK